MNNTTTYFCNALLFLCFLLLFQLVFELDYSTHWRLFFSDGSSDEELSESFESSIWCHNDSDKHRLCSLKNICFSPLHKQFIFILSSNSTLLGVGDKRDLTLLDLSSVSSHNKFMLKIAIVSPNSSILKNKFVSKEPVQLLWRFKVDNIMHVVHDDLLPLFTTYSKMCVGNVKKCVSKYRLAFVDEEKRGPFHDWYKVLSKNEPLTLTSLHNDRVTCFEDAQMGLMRSSVWFQYGFGTHQGPTNNSGVTKKLMHLFTNFMQQNLNSRPQNHRQYTSAVLFKREINRKIVNYDFVIKCMQKSFSLTNPELPKLEVFVLDLSLNDSKTVISIISQSKLVVGMHGAEMILSIFLPAGSVVVELFPFGIVPSHVSPLKYLVNITSSIFYESWENLDAINSHAHPEAPALLGGISHLSPSEQLRIKAIVPVPAVQCCHDAAYLYRMFQDTTVGRNFLPLLQQALTKQKRWTMPKDKEEILMWSRWWLPGPISNVSCIREASTAVIKWTPPLNVDGFNVEYAVTVSADGKVMEYTSSESWISTTPVQSDSSTLNIWIKCIAVDFNVESIDTHKTCVF